MNELLQKHGCANVFTIPEGLKELMSDITREVLREQPSNIFEFITNYLSVLILTREHGVMAIKILEDLCDCRPSVSNHLLQIGVEPDQVHVLADIIKEEIENFEPAEGKEKLKEYQILKKVLKQAQIDEVLAVKVCQVARNAYRDYWYTKKTLEKKLKVTPEEPWEVAAERTLAIYAKTKPSFDELTRAAEKIQAAYRGYYVRRNLLRHLKPKHKKKGPKVELPGPPQDIAGARQINFGPLIAFTVIEENVRSMFDDHATEKLGLPYDPMTTLTHVPMDEEEVYEGEMRMSRASATSNLSQLTPVEARQTESHLPHSPKPSIAKLNRQSRNPSQIAAASHRISFSMVKPKIIPSEDEVKSQPKSPQENNSPQENAAATEFFELIKPKYLAVETEQEIPEDIEAGSATDEAESAPASVPSSAPGTAPTTDDEEDVADLNTTGEDVG